jgi:hypothetical protein
MASSDDDKDLSEERRKILKHGLAVAPLLVTLAARPLGAGQPMGSLGTYDYAQDPTSEDSEDDDDREPPGHGRGKKR